MSVRVWSLDPLVEVACLKGHAACVHAVAYDPLGRWLISGSSDHTVRVWDVETNLQRAAFFGHENMVRGLRTNPDGTRSYSGGVDRSVRVWDALRTDEPEILVVPPHKVGGAAFSPNGRLLATAVFDGSIWFWEAHSGTVLASVREHKDRVNCVAFSPDGTMLASGGDDNRVRFWELATCKVKSSVRFRRDVLEIAFSPDGTRLACFLEENSFEILDLKSESKMLRVDHEPGYMMRVGFVDNGNKISGKFLDGTTHTWECDTGRRTEAIPLEPQYGSVAARGPFTARLALAQPSDEIIVDDTTIGEPIGWFPIAAITVAAAPEPGRWAAICNLSSNFHLFKVEPLLQTSTIEVP